MGRVSAPVKKSGERKGWGGGVGCSELYGGEKGKWLIKPKWRMIF